MIDELKNWTYDTFVKFLDLLKRNYRIVPFCEVSEVTGAHLILRHDVDASLEAALKMARIEHENAVRSTYFVMFSSAYYNTLEIGNCEMLREISKLGHEIGLHYDVITYESYGRDLRATLNLEIKVLEHLIGKRVVSIARHNPSLTTGEDPFKDIKGYINAYDPELCRNYVSDSCRAWYLDDLGRLLNNDNTRVQLLLHPFLWTEDICERDVVLERLFQGIEKRNEAYKQKELSEWHDSRGVKEYDKALARYDFKHRKR